MVYYFSHDGQSQHGPVRPEELRQIGLTPQTLIWREGLSGWTRAGDLTELADLFPTPLNSSAMQVQRPGGEGRSAVLTTYAHPERTNGFAVASMICGILGVVGLCGYAIGGLLPAILAVVFGHLARGQIRRNAEQGAGLALSGLIMGYIVIGLAVIVILFFLLLFLLPIAAATTARGGL